MPILLKIQETSADYLSRVKTALILNERIGEGKSWNHRNKRRREQKLAFAVNLFHRAASEPAYRKQVQKTNKRYTTFFPSIIILVQIRKKINFKGFFSRFILAFSPI